MNRRSFLKALGVVAMAPRAAIEMLGRVKVPAPMVKLKVSMLAWVDSSVRSSGNGTVTSPFKTISEALDEGADVVHVINPYEDRFPITIDRPGVRIQGVTRGLDD